MMNAYLSLVLCACAIGHKSVVSVLQLWMTAPCKSYDRMMCQWAVENLYNHPITSWGWMTYSQSIMSYYVMVCTETPLKVGKGDVQFLHWDHMVSDRREKWITHWKQLYKMNKLRTTLACLGVSGVQRHKHTDGINRYFQLYILKKMMHTIIT